MRSFHELATFYRQFIKEFSTVMALITNCLKKGEFTWSSVVSKAFIEIKKRIVIARLPDFSKVFEVACDASEIGIDRVLTQEDHPVVYFS